MPQQLQFRRRLGLIVLHCDDIDIATSNETKIQATKAISTETGTETTESRTETRTDGRLFRTKSTRHTKKIQLQSVRQDNTGNVFRFGWNRHDEFTYRFGGYEYRYFGAE